MDERDGVNLFITIFIFITKEVLVMREVNTEYNRDSKCILIAGIQYPVMFQVITLV